MSCDSIKMLPSKESFSNYVYSIYIEMGFGIK